MIDIFQLVLAGLGKHLNVGSEKEVAKMSLSFERVQLFEYH